MEKGQYVGRPVVLKKSHVGASAEVIKTFVKEALLLSTVNHENVVAMIAVCDEPISIMMECCEFDFKIFGARSRVTSLDKFLELMDEENYYSSFPGIGNVISKNIFDSVFYLHSNDMVHRDIKPGNILVSNVHYSHLCGKEMKKVFENSPIICKLGDLGEARSTYTRTNALIKNSQTKVLNRGSQAYMAPEISLQEELISSASIDDLKNVDVWALLMTIFIILNPDQKYPFQEMIKEFEYSVYDMERQFKLCLKNRESPSMSKKYTKEQSCNYQRLRLIFHQSLQFNPKDRPTMSELKKLLQEGNSANIHFLPLNVSQATALEKNDFRLITDEKLDETSVPHNDGTNACAFLSLGVIDTLVSTNVKLIELNDEDLNTRLSYVITEYPKCFNPFRDNHRLYDAYEAYAILVEIKVIGFHYNFKEMFVNNATVYSFEFQKEFFQELHRASQQATEQIESQYFIFQASPYIFTICVTANGEYYVFETHPIGEELNGNGNGIIVKSNSAISISERIMKRLVKSNVPDVCTPFKLLLN